MRDQIDAALKDALKAKRSRETNTLRLIKAAIRDRDIAGRTSGNDKVGDEEILAILSKMIKQREESSKIYEEASRLELAAQEREEMEIIAAFMPAQMQEEEMRQVCKDVVEDLDAGGLRDMGRCIKTLKQRYPGKMDFGKASAIIKEMLQ